MTKTPKCGSIVEKVVALLLRNRDVIEANRPCQIIVHLPPDDNPTGEPHLELGKIKLR